MASEAWTRERVVGAIRRWHDVRGVAPRQRDWTKPTFGPGGVPETPAADVVLELFGKWSEAVRAAGLESEKQERSRKQKQELPDRSQREYLDDDLYYKSDEAQPPYYSPAGAYLAAAEVIAELYRWTALTGSSPSERDWLRDKQWPHPDVVIDVFGSWDDAIRDAGLDKFEPPPRADADIEELRGRLAGLERELTTERQTAERELRAARRVASRAQETERQARVDNERAQEVARAAREEAKRARADAAARAIDTKAEKGSDPSLSDPSGEVASLTERLIEVEARAEHLEEENERLRRALGQVREAMGADD